MLTKDRLWKAILEDFFQYAILFYFSSFYEEVDWSKGFVVLDKELRELFPESKGNERRADLLVKVWLKDGSERWVLIHVEVQGQKDDHFAERMFVYFYRIKDRFRRPIASLAILTDTNKNWRPNKYVEETVETKLVYEYPVFKLLDHTSKDFDNDPNPWAIVMKAALIGLKGKWSDEALLNAKVALYKELRGRGYSKTQVRNLLQFIKYYVRFDQKEYFRKFDNELQKINNEKNKTMGIIELVKEHLIEEAKQEGIEQGIEQGMQKGDLKRAIISIRNMAKEDFPTEKIANLLSLKEALVRKVLEQLKKEDAVVSLLAKGQLSSKEIAKQLKVSDLLVEVLKEGEN